MRRLGVAKFISVMGLPYDIKIKVMHLSQEDDFKQMVDNIGQEKSSPVHNPTRLMQGFESLDIWRQLWNLTWYLAVAIDNLWSKSRAIQTEKAVEMKNVQHQALNLW